MTSASPTAATADFARLPLSPAMLANLQQLGYLTMTPILACALLLWFSGKAKAMTANSANTTTSAVD